MRDTNRVHAKRQANMYSPRSIKPLTSWRDPDGVKVYTISANGGPVDHHAFLPRFEKIKAQKGVNWRMTPGFAIFHSGATMLYLVVAWWGNGNELFTSVSVREGETWVEDSSRYSFCLWDLELFWFERNSFVRHLYSGSANLEAYRKDMGCP